MRLIQYISTILLFIGLISCSPKPQYTITKVNSYNITIDETFDSNQYEEGQKILCHYRGILQDFMDDTIGYSETFMPRIGVENLLCNFSSDALREVSKTIFDMPSIDICILNAKGFRTDMPQGYITVSDVFNIYPFENFVTLLEIRGSDIRDLFESFAYKNNFESFSGVKLTVKDRKLLEIYIGDEPIDDNKIYNVATIDFVADGNDDMTPLTKAINRYDSEITLRDAMVQYTKDMTSQGKQLQSRIDGRICHE